jgi:hypothetical protein
MDEDWTIDLDESPRPEDVQAVQAGLRAYNRSRVPVYERCGYEVFGTLEDYPVGHQRHFMRKSLAPAGRLADR